MIVLDIAVFFLSLSCRRYEAGHNTKGTNPQPPDYISNVQGTGYAAS